MGDHEMRDLQAKALADAESQDGQSQSNISLSSHGSSTAWHGSAPPASGFSGGMSAAAGGATASNTSLPRGSALVGMAAAARSAVSMVAGGDSRVPMLGRQVAAEPGGAGIGDLHNTLNEPVKETIMRDVRSIAEKMNYVMMLRTRTDGCQRLKDWDLWGPLILCLILGSVLSHEATDNEQASYAFADIFVTVWLGSAVVTVNAQLLRGKVSFFQTVCVIGYCIAPLVAAAVMVWLYQRMPFFPPLFLSFLKVVHVGAGLAWATRASVGFVAELVPPDRKMLGVYPVWLFYVAIAWMIILA